MTEDNNQNHQPTEEQQPSDETQTEYREISDEELKKILEDHNKWLESDGKEGEKADLKRANLQGANLRNVNLQKAELTEANLQGANLAQANLKDASLGNANLQEANIALANLQAYLVGANLQKAKIYLSKLQSAYLVAADLNESDLSQSKMQNAILDNVKGLSTANIKYANLEGATGLLGNEFAQTDVTGTKLPDDIKDFKALETVEKTSQNARKIFFAMLSGCVYSWLTIATTTDVRLLTNTSSSPLPIIGTEIPIAWFYITAPLVLISLFLYFHFYLLGLWESLAGLPAIFPDGKRLDERAYPWLLNRLVRKHFKRLKDDRPIMAKLQELIVIILAWWVVPITMTGFWLRYLVRHELIGTSIHIFLLFFSVTFSLIFFRLCKAILQRDEIETFSFKNFLHDKISYYVILIGFVLIFSSFVGFSIWGADFREKDISIKPSDYYKIETVEKQIESVKGADLKGRNLNNADMYDAFLVKTDLRGASLKSADLKGVNLQKANLEGADLRKANLQGANLQEANLQGANLQKALLYKANLQEANLESANLQEAILQEANLQEANLESANLQKANLHGANLQKAKLRGVNLQEANLNTTNLQKTKLRGVNLHKALLRGANLQETDIRNLIVEQADFEKANLQQASFIYADFAGAKNLTIEQLSKVKTLYKAKLDPELMEQVKKCCPHLLEEPKEEPDQTK